MSTPLSDQQEIEIMEKIAGLLLGREQGTLSEADARELQHWLDQQSEDHRAFYDDMTTSPVLETSLRTMQQVDEVAALDDVWNRIGVNVDAKIVPAKRVWMRWAAAAAIASVVVISSAIIILHKQKKTLETPMAARYSSDVLPGGDKAVLELADGSQIVLDSASNGVLAVQGNASVLKKDDGTIAYTAAGNAASQEITYNKISTPRGGQFKLVLPDGTQVWLNAASSLRYPAVFTGNQRTVTLTGEAYFEVAPDASKQFYVNVPRGEKTPLNVQVLGTSFNIQAYPDEPAHSATLETGKIRVITNDNSVVLAPGQQAQAAANGQFKVVNADLDEVLAWKAGIFYLQDASIQEIMRQVSRWYDVDVKYEGNITQQFIGKIPRNTNLSDVLTILESTGYVHFELKGKDLIVRP
ncbi:FecR family protein [Chitinophaga jiangningensis]|uniref:FecR family protein n=1 Tax=Chitinophaga jiangningensis TaxID=1419482 RepID=A0A1M6V9C6_9BACT|nr:FecR family protein [Chitinophaga jiangningensis]SHK78049.1 FecR family protein [Chitinophaga jiangningensis]